MSSANSNRKSKNPLTPLRTAVRIEDQSLLGAPPLIPFDDPAAYDRLLAAVTQAIKPMDFLEMIWARDVTDLQWEITRCRRIRAKIIEGGVESEITGDDETRLTSSVTFNIQLIERLDRMIASMEARRNAACHEADRHRANLGTLLRRAAEEVEDAEFSEVEEPGEQKHAA
jgi:hypothetical protein